MRRLFIAALAAGLVLPASLRAEGPDDKYIEIYRLIQEADQLAGSSQTDFARQKYREAQSELKKLQASYPNWNEKLVQFRLRLLDNKLGGGATNAAPPMAEAPAATNAPSATPSVQTSLAPMPTVPVAQPPAVAAPPVAPSQPDDRDNQIKILQSQVGQLQSDKSVLENKLREALAAQPAAIDPRELARAEERIRSLEKEKEVLKVSTQVAEEKASRANESNVTQAKKDLQAAKQKLAEQSDMIMALRQEKEVLQKQVADANRSGEETLGRLRAENEILKKQLSEKPALMAAAPGNEQMEKELASTKSALQSTRDTASSLQVRLRKLEEERDQLEKTRKDLEGKLAAGSAASESAQIKRLQKDRDELQKKLNDTAKQLAETKSPKQAHAPAPPEDVSGLRARLEVLEARRVPYTPEELALFQKPQDGALVATASLEPKPEAPAAPGVAVLLADAQRAFTARRFDEAEKKYQEALQLDGGKNATTFQRLAAAQLEQNRPKDAEATLKRSLEQNPSDPRSLLLMGIAKFDQEKYDEAMENLSRAAQIDPQNPETQNYLGITLSQKGQRAAAETALRKAIQIDPGYKSAHYNLAVVYATQQPPFLELARWHYQKAIAYGHPANAELEKMIEKKQAAAPK